MLGMLGTIDGKKDMKFSQRKIDNNASAGSPGRNILGAWPLTTKLDSSQQNRAT
jgi:hypothetical protein